MPWEVNGQSQVQLHDSVHGLPACCCLCQIYRSFLALLLLCFLLQMCNALAYSVFNVCYIAGPDTSSISVS